jgi:hypothetical protein
MDKFLYLLAALVFAASVSVCAFNITLIKATPNVTLATAANLMIFPGTLLFQSVVLLTLGLVVQKLNRLLRGSRYAEFIAAEEAHTRRL